MTYLKPFFILSGLLLLASCTPKSSGSLELNGASSLLAPAPKAGTSVLRAEMTRFRGQTSFLTVSGSSGYRGGLESAPMAAAAPQALGGAPRAEQEADVFKVGKPGSKLLYLLNSYRGLQVVSYAKGTESPELLGRAEPSGNYPSDMYMDPKQDRLFVLERVWFSADNKKYNPNQSRILVYDVSQPDKPKVTAEVDVKGVVADSRIVGEVLYVVSTLRPDYNSYEYQRGKNTQKGFVTSYDLSGAKVKQIQELTLSLPAVYGTNLRVVTVPQGSSYKYYLVANTSETGWGWWDNVSMVQVVDISDDRGKISKVMTVSVKGSVQRPHQMQIKNDTLVVVSNYRIPAPSADNRNRAIARIAVETFKFPTDKSETVTEDEAQMRRLYIEKQVKIAADAGTDKEVARAKWMSDATWGMGGRFIAKGDELQKLSPDSLVTTGDSTGLSASLQDVRVQDNFLYAFWVPANQVDPLDVFDFSHPENGIKFLKRLQFDGWISRAEPISYGGRNFIIGLGWIVPAENNETNKRFAQVKLFEITSTPKQTAATEVESLVLSQGQFYANFNGQDKYIEFKPTGDGQGEILFEGTRYNSTSSSYSYQEGGQIISYDLSNVSGTKNVLQEGSFLAGDSSWLKRIFTNSEIERINSFSEASLVTFGKQDKAVGVSTVQAAHVLELARNIRGFAVVGGKGVQIISESSYWGSQAKSQTTLRVVAKNNVDSEKNQVGSELVLAGSYVQHIEDTGSDSLLVLTSTPDANSKSYTMAYQVHRVTSASGQKLASFASQSWTPAPYSNRQSSASGPSLVASSIVPRYGSSTTMVQLPSGELLVSVDNEIKLVDALTTKGVVVKAISFDKCDVSKGSSSEVKTLAGKIYFVRKEPVDLKTEMKTYYQATRNEMAVVSSANGVMTCGKFVNIPGNLLAFDGEKMIVSDSWSNDVYEDKQSKQDVVSVVSSVTSLKLNAEGTKAELVDMIDSGNSEYALTGEGKNQSLVRYVSKQNYTPAAIEFLQLDQNAFLTQRKHTLPDSSLEYGSLAKVIADPTQPGTYLGVVKSWRQMQVMRWSSDNSRPQMLKLAPVDMYNKRQDLTDVVSILEGYSSGDTIHYSADQKSFEISSGQYGVKQFFIE